jgi:hypothetical protein
MAYCFFVYIIPNVCLFVFAISKQVNEQAMFLLLLLCNSKLFHILHQCCCLQGSTTRHGFSVATYIQSLPPVCRKFKGMVLRTKLLIGN